ncbi:MAG: alpha/beta hydrolase [Nanoarchaeota archaeon]
MEKLTFNNGSGIELSGILSDDDTSKPIVIMCHGFSSNKGRPFYTDLERLLAEKSISTFRFDFYGHGESQGLFKDITLNEGLRDLDAAIKFIKEKGFTKIAILGSSYGGMVVLLAAASHPELKAVIGRAPVSHHIAEIIVKKSGATFAEWEDKGEISYLSGDGRRLPLNTNFLKDSPHHDVRIRAKSITIPVKIIHGDKDPSVPLAQSKETAKLIPGCTLKVIKGADHAFKGHDDECLSEALTFLDSHLKQYP